MRFDVDVWVDSEGLVQTLEMLLILFWCIENMFYVCQNQDSLKQEMRCGASISP